MMPHNTLQTRFFMSLLIGVGILTFIIFKPYFGVLVLTATLAVIFHPLYRRLLMLLGNRANLTALATTVIILLIIFVPFVFFGIKIFQEAQGLYTYATSPSGTYLHTPLNTVKDRLHSIAPDLVIDFDTYAKNSLAWLLQHLGPAFSSVLKLTLNLFLSLLALFYLLRDGGKLIRKIIAQSPLSDRYDQLILSRLQTAVNSVIRGSLTIAVIQGIASGIGLALFGVPNAALWGSVTVLAALIPNIGTATVLTPAIIYLFLTDQILPAAGLLLWSILAVGLIDNILGPKLINRDIKVHPMIILLAVIGGLGFFGPTGYILGPLVISLLFALLDIYPHFIPKKTA